MILPFPSIPTLSNTHVHIFNIQKLHQRLNEVTGQLNVLGVETGFAVIVKV